MFLTGQAGISSGPGPWLFREGSSEPPAFFPRSNMRKDEFQNDMLTWDRSSQPVYPAL